MISSAFLQKLKPRDFQMCKCGHTRFWHSDGKCLMTTTQYGQGNEDFDYCQCIEFNLSASVATKTDKRIGRKSNNNKNKNSTSNFFILYIR
jgi:hypothetical protein